MRVRTQSLLSAQLLGVLLCASVNVAAYSAQVQQRVGFESLDANNDHQVSREELVLEPELRRHFDVADRNQDGVLTKREFEQLTRAFEHYVVQLRQ